MPEIVDVCTENLTRLASTSRAIGESTSGTAARQWQTPEQGSWSGRHSDVAGLVGPFDRTDANEGYSGASWHYTVGLDGSIMKHLERGDDLAEVCLATRTFFFGQRELPSEVCRVFDRVLIEERGEYLALRDHDVVLIRDVVVESEAVERMPRVRFLGDRTHLFAQRKIYRLLGLGRIKAEARRLKGDLRRKRRKDERAHAQSRVVEKARSLGVIALIEREDGLRLGQGQCARGGDRDDAYSLQIACDDGHGSGGRSRVDFDAGDYNRNQRCRRVPRAVVALLAQEEEVRARCRIDRQVRDDIREMSAGTRIGEVGCERTRV
jgi:hypothetical protein